MIYNNNIDVFFSEAVMVAPVTQSSKMHIPGMSMDVNEQKQWWQLEEVGK